jgi:hypothetical protein
MSEYLQQGFAMNYYFLKRHIGVFSVSFASYIISFLIATKVGFKKESAYPNYAAWIGALVGVVVVSLLGDYFFPYTEDRS